MSQVLHVKDIFQISAKTQIYSNLFKYMIIIPKMNIYGIFTTQNKD